MRIHRNTELRNNYVKYKPNNKERSFKQRLVETDTCYYL